MSGCRPFKNQLGRYHDGELSSAGCARMEQHLRTCRACSEELAEVRRVSEALWETLEPPPVPAALTAKIMARARRQPAGDRAAWGSFWFWRSWSLPVRFAAAGVAAAAIYIGLAIGSASLSFSRPSGDEMQWVRLTSQGPLVTAYVEDNR